MFLEQFFRPDGTRLKIAAAIGAYTRVNVINAAAAKRTLKRADHGLR